MSRFSLKRFAPVITLLVVGISVAIALLPAYGNSPLLTPRSILLQDATPSAVTTYTVYFTVQNAQTLGSIELQFCGNSPLENDVCNAPVGFTAANAILHPQSGYADLYIYSKTANDLILSHMPASITSPLAIGVTFQNMTNSSAVGTSYLRISTYATTDGSGTRNSFGGVAYALNPVLNVSTYVPPYLTLCSAVTISNYDCSKASGNYINFGDLTTTSASSATSQAYVATNAQSGYALYASGPTLTSGNNIIPSLTSEDISRPGTNQFGINLSANQDPIVGAEPSGPGTGTAIPAYDTPNLFHYVSGDAIASNASVEAGRLYTISYLININHDQPPGVYATTMVYTALANF